MSIPAGLKVNGLVLYQGKSWVVDAISGPDEIVIRNPSNSNDWKPVKINEVKVLRNAEAKSRSETPNSKRSEATPEAEATPDGSKNSHGEKRGNKKGRN